MREKRRKIGRNNGIRKLAVFGVLLILLAVQLCMSQRTAYAGEKNTYLLEVSTGVSDGSCIGFFCITFVDDSGKKHKEYIFPNDGDYYDSYQTIAQLSKGYMEKREILQKQGYTFKKWQDSVYQVALDKNSIDSYIIETDYRVKTVESISVCSDKIAGVSSSWTCRSMKLYQIDKNKIGGFSMYGYISGDSYLDFSGKLIAQLGELKEKNEKTGDVVLKNTDRTFSFSNDEEIILSPKPKRHADSLYVYSEDLTKEGVMDTLPEKESSIGKSYLFKLDLADQYGAGIEAFANDSSKADLMDMKLPEVLDLRVTYTDGQGMDRTVHIPYFTNAVAYAQEKIGTDQKICVADFAGQGESIVFSGTLDNCSEIKNVKLTYGVAEALKESGMTEDGSSSLRTKRKNQIKEDSFSLTGFSVYEMDESSRDAIQFENLEESGNILRLKIPEGLKPSWYYTAPSGKGVELKSGKNLSLQMKSYTPGASITPTDAKRRYLLVIDTFQKSSATSASSRPDLSISLNYKNPGGKDKSTSTMQLEDLAKAYYGFVPDTNQKDCSYSMGIAAGGRLYAVFEQKDVDRFTGATFSIKSQQEWQISNFSIYLIDDLSLRKARWQNERKTAFGQTSFVEYYRLVNGQETLDKTTAMFDSPVSMLVKNGESKSINFDSKTVTEADTAYDWMKEEKYSMKYETAISNLGFINMKYQYEIAVKVDDNSGNGVDDEDSGSKNFFYFQLIFADGESAVVQANQQLASDGFLTGQTASFYIGMNRDYGELKAVKIIPDDVTVNADPYDKLNVDQITITLSRSTGQVQTWTVSDVGWIGIEYKEDEENSPANKTTRSIDEIARVYNVSMGETSAEFQFAITTGSYSNQYVSEDDTTKVYQQFEGAVFAEIGYTNNEGRYCTADVDVVAQMYSYADKTPIAKTVQVNGKDRTVSDTSYMFRENHTDRFTIRLGDVSRIDDIKLYVAGTQEGVLNIKSMSVALVTSRGALLINCEGEYERNGKIVPVTTNEASIGTIPIYKDKAAEKHVYFLETDDNMISDIASGTWAYTETRDPISVNDYVNIIVYPDDSVKEDGTVKRNEDGTEEKKEFKGISMSARLRYGDAYGQLLETRGDLEYHPMNKGGSELGDEQCFYIMKLGAQCFENLVWVELKSDQSVPLKKAIVQQVRKGKIVESYSCDLTDQDAKNTARGTGSRLESGNNYKQVITLQLGEVSSIGINEKDISTLVAEKKDIGVRFHYRSTEDPTGIEEYTSQLVYATEKNTKQEIGKGTTLTFTYSGISDVKEITGITVSATGWLDINVEKACIGNYQISQTGTVDNGTTGITSQNGAQTLSDQTDSTQNSTQEKLIGWYSINKNTEVKNGSKKLTVDSSQWQGADTVTPVYINFATSTEMNAGTDGKIRMVVNYLDSCQKEQTAEFADIQNSTYEGNYQSGSVAKVRLLLTDCQEISSITLEPYSSQQNGMESWSPETMEITYGVGDPDKLYHKMCSFDNEVIYEGIPKTIGVSNVMVEVKYEVNGEPFVITNNSKSHILKSDEQIKMDYTVYNSSKGVSIKAYKIADAAGGGVSQVDAYSEVIRSAAGDSVIFKAPNNTSGKDMNYLVIFESKENASKKCSITFTVQPGENESDINVTTDYWLGEQQYTVVNGSDNASVESGAKVKMKFRVTGAQVNNDVIIKAESVSGTVKDVTKEVMKQEGNYWYFNAPENTTGVVQNYQITAESREKAGLKCTVTFSVQQEQEKELTMEVTYSVNGKETAGSYTSGDEISIPKINNGDKIEFQYKITNSSKGAEASCKEDGESNAATLKGEKRITFTAKNKSVTKNTRYTVTIYAKENRNVKCTFSIEVLPCQPMIDATCFYSGKEVTLKLDGETESDRLVVEPNDKVTIEYSLDRGNINLADYSVYKLKSDGKSFDAFIPASCTKEGNKISFTVPNEYDRKSDHYYSILLSPSHDEVDAYNLTLEFRFKVPKK